MFISQLKATELNHRLDSSHYQPDSMDAERKLRLFGNLCLLRDVVDKRRPITNGVRGPDLQLSNFRLIRLQDCDGFFVNFKNCLTISERQFHENRRCAVQDNDVIVAIGGYIGHASVATKTVPSVIGQHSALLSNSSGIDSFYLASYLNSRIGALQFQRYVSGTVQQGINLEDIREILIPIPLIGAQKYIGDKVRQAERLRGVSSVMRSEISSLMLSCFSGAPKPNRSTYTRVSVFDTKVNRLEAEYYGNIALWAEAEILGSRFETKRLGDLASRIKDGPGGWGVSTNDYVSSGIPVIRGVNLVDGDCDLKDCVFISAEKHRELRGHRAVRGSVVLSVRGTVGRSAVFDVPGLEEASLNAAVVTIDCNDEIHPHYLAEFFNSEIGQIQTTRIANGAVQQNMNLTETQSNRIVVPPMEFQLDIANRRMLRIQASRQSGQLIEAAKLLGEALIERNVTEEELIEARTRLEQGDDSADREILRRLFKGGWEATETQPLFPDLDGYYDTLRMVERESTEVTAK